jgi:aspartate kinase
MTTLIMKFGGASVAEPSSFSRIASIISFRKKEYHNVVVVVSAMGNTTDQLLTLAAQVNENPPRRELDMLVTVGERISISLLAMALAKIKLEAISFTGSQSGIITCENHTEARIIEVRPHRLQESLLLGKVVIVAGFQGVSEAKEITTLGRGGSDTSAVALAVALEAEKVEFYKDVPGIYSLDPKRCPSPQFYPYLSYEDALDISVKGAKILHSRCVELAKANGMPLHIRSFKERVEPEFQCGTLIYDDRIPRGGQKIYEQLPLRV